ncbi:MAG: RHS repeat-associated core domain-containing protein [Opitutaceae bacterium]|nr:RHS repeat-associated core domain-containing protein [Opitutaceae bacterium]
MKSLSVVSHAFFITRDFEANRDLLTKVETKWSSTTRTRYDYAYDDRRLRQSVVQSGDVFSDYGGTDGGAIHQIFAYNARGEVTTAATYLGATATDQTTPLSARKHEWDYDGLGNRKWSNTSGNSALKDNYTVNELNQYTGRENNTLAIGGVADADALVAARSTALAGRAGKHWGDNITVENWLAPFSGNLKVYAVKPGSGGAAYARQTIERTAFLPPAAQSFAYDADGNLTNDGVWSYEWDAENRLTAMEATAGAVMGGMTAQKLEFKYDYMNRRAEKLVRGGWNGTSYTTVTSQRRYLWDGWSLLAEFNFNSSTSTLTKVRTYAWGLDIARSMKDAGGVGALLQIRDHASGKDYFPSYDGNGNIAALFDASDGSVGAAYEYSPYGEFLRCEGAYAKENPFRFSTKFTDDETGLVYYGRRYYQPSQGRFVGRDTIQERGGLNLYGFCGNNGVNRWDVLGMEPEHAGELGERWTCSSEGKEWLKTWLGWVMVNDGTGEGEYSGVGGPPEPTWQINGMSLPGQDGALLASLYMRLDEAASSNSAPATSGSSRSSSGPRPGHYDEKTDQWVYPDGRRVGFSTGNGDAVVVSYQQTGTGDWVSWDTANVLGQNTGSLAAAVDRLSPADSAASVAAIPRGGVNSDWAAVHGALVNVAPVMGTGANAFKVATVIGVAGPALLVASSPALIAGAATVVRVGTTMVTAGRIAGTAAVGEAAVVLGHPRSQQAMHATVNFLEQALDGPTTRFDSRAGAAGWFVNQLPNAWSQANRGFDHYSGGNRGGRR